MSHLLSTSDRPRVVALATPNMPLWAPYQLGHATRAISPSEQQHVTRFRSSAQKQARCIARNLVVQAADMLGCLGKSVVLKRDSHGRPFLAGTDLDVNFSHTPGLTVCAMSLGCRVGVDVELHRELQFEEITPALSGPEKERVQSGNLPGSLLSCWTAKEAVLKGDGRGFSPGLEAHDLFSPEPVLDGVRWYVSRHVFDYGATTYLCALATDVSDALVAPRLGVNTPLSRSIACKPA